MNITNTQFSTEVVEFLTSLPEGEYVDADFIHKNTGVALGTFSSWKHAMLIGGKPQTRLVLIDKRLERKLNSWHPVNRKKKNAPTNNKTENPASLVQLADEMVDLAEKLESAARVLTRLDQIRQNLAELVTL